MNRPPKNPKDREPPPPLCMALNWCPRNESMTPFCRKLATSGFWCPEHAPRVISLKEKHEE
jgi:hypothetical protein